MSILQTSRATERITCDCGQAFSAEVYRTINLSTDPSLLDSLLAGSLNQVRCGSCSRQLSADTPVYIHDPAAGRFVCLYPAAYRSQELALRVQFYQELLGQGAASVPGYVREARFVFGLDPCGQALGRVAGAAASTPAPVAPPAVRPASTPRPGGQTVQELGERDFEQVRDVESVDRRDAALIQRWKESGQNHYTFLDEGALHIFQRDSAPERFGERGELFFQLQRTENFPLVVLLLVAETKTGENLVLYWLFNLDNSVDVQFLEQLSGHFEVRLHLFDPRYTRKRTFVFSPSLEQNVAYVLDEARRWLEGIEPARRNFFLAASKFDDRTIGKLGRDHSALDPAAFRELPTPSVTHLALEILTYWSSRQNYEYLIFIKSFPVPSFKVILGEVLRRAIHFGLALSEKMKRLSVELQLVGSKPELVSRLLANFAEVAEGLRPNDLDPQSQSENWSQLLKDAAELGLEPSPEILRLAKASAALLEEARQSIPLDLADDVETLGALNQLKTSELLTLLREKENRAEAARILAEAGQPESLSEVAKAFGKMDRHEIDLLGDSLACFGPAAREFLRRAVQGRKTAQAVGALRALVRLDGAASAALLLQELEAGRAGVWREALDLAKRLPELPVPAVLASSRHPDPAVRKRVASLVGSLKAPEARRRLEELASEDPDEPVRLLCRQLLDRPAG